LYFVVDKVAVSQYVVSTGRGKTKQKLEKRRDKMTLTNKMKNMLEELVAGHETKAMLAIDWDRRTLNALEKRGLVEVRDCDGYIKVTNRGELAARVSYE